MAIIQPLKKIFNWQLASEKILYKSYVAQIGQVGTDPITAIELVNDIGNLTYVRDSIGVYRIKFPKPIPSNKLFIPNATEYFGFGTVTIPITNNTAIIGYVSIYPSLTPLNSFADSIVIGVQDATWNYIDFDSILNAGGNEGRWYFEFRVYN